MSAYLFTFPCVFLFDDDNRINQTLGADAGIKAAEALDYKSIV